MLDSDIFRYYTYKREYRALYSKLMLKVEVVVLLKVYYIRRGSIGLAGLAYS